MLARDYRHETRKGSLLFCESPHRVLILDKTPSIRLFIASLNGGGSERVCFQLSNEMAKRGLDVEVMLVKATGPFLNHLDPRVRIKDFDCPRALKAFAQVSRYLRTAPHVPVLVFGFHLAVGLLLTKSLGLHRTRTVYREGSSPRSSVRPSMHWGYRLMIRRADRVIASNRTVAEELRQLGVPGELITVIPNPAGRMKGHDEPRVRRASGDAPLIIAVGRLAIEKGFDRLIRGFKQLQGELPSARLVILGEGPERGALTQLVRELGLERAVAMPGFVHDLSRWYQEASLFVLSSHFEGQPNALIEAILYECPIVCAAGRGGTVDLLEEVGLQDCLVTSAEFEQGFAERARFALAQNESRWNAAAERLVTVTNPTSVVDQYLAACGVDQ